MLERIGDKWSVVVVCLLGESTYRYNELRRLAHPITQRMLSVTLRGLERDGLVSRTVYATVPPRVDYALTERGRSLLGVVRDLATWADGHKEEISASRAAFDAREQ
ncbi:winged helix-turn-helix transcriptional regulator [Streptomyces sp. NPDC003393]